MDELLTTAERLRELISQKHISYAELERLSGVPKSAIHRYASGDTKKIPLDRIFRISEALGVSPFDLVGEDRPWGTDQSLGVEYAKWEFGGREPAASEEDSDNDDDLWTLREELRRDPERRRLFKIAAHASLADVKAADALINALAATNPDFYDGDDPA